MGEVLCIFIYLFEVTLTFIPMTEHCPYNPAHIVPKDSLLRHLNRCTATNKSEFGNCKFNQLHVFRKQALERHHQKCPDKRQKSKYQEDVWQINDNPTIDNFDQDDSCFYEQRNKRGEGRPKKNAAPPQPPKKKTNNNWESDEEQFQKPGKYDKKWEQNQSIQTVNGKNSLKKQLPFDCNQSVVYPKKRPQQLNQSAKMQDF